MYPVKIVTFLIAVIVLEELFFRIYLDPRYDENVIKPVQVNFTFIPSAPQNNQDIKEKTNPTQRMIFTSTASSILTDWKILTLPNIGFSMMYPPEFTVNQRGKVGKNDHVMALTFQAKNKVVTVLTLIPDITSNQTYKTHRIIGNDQQGNHVVSYQIPLKKGVLIINGADCSDIEPPILFLPIIDQIIQNIKLI